MTQPPNRLVHSPAPTTRMRWARRHRTLTALLAALVPVLAVGITLGTLGASHPAGGTDSAPQAAAVTTGARWLTGPAGRLLRAVNADVGRLSTGERAGRRDVARVAGTHLAADTQAALSGPMPPADAKMYRSALKDLERAGTSAVSGKFDNANTFLNAGDSDITKVTAAVDHPAAVNIPAAVSEPNGQ